MSLVKNYKAGGFILEKLSEYRSELERVPDGGDISQYIFYCLMMMKAGKKFSELNGDD